MQTRVDVRVTPRHALAWRAGLCHVDRVSVVSTLHLHTSAHSAAAQAYTRMLALLKYLQITFQIKQLVLFFVCLFLTAFFASKLEHESKHCNGKGIQRPGSSAFERVYTAK